VVLDMRKEGPVFTMADGLLIYAAITHKQAHAMSALCKYIGNLYLKCIFLFRYSCGEIAVLPDLFWSKSFTLLLPSSNTCVANIFDVLHVVKSAKR
jgi:hypothetical protein